MPLRHLDTLISLFTHLFAAGVLCGLLGAYMTTHHPVATPSPTTRREAEVPLMALGDERWAQRRPLWRERELALAWPLDLLEKFSLRMARHGMCISRGLMMCDRRYAVEQLTHAKSIEDPCLYDLATQLFTHYEARPAGVRALH